MKKVLVTGGNAGIGFALCTQLVGENGCHVYLCSRNADKGKAAVSKILEKYPEGKCELVVMDVGKDESVAAAAKALSSVTFYGIVNNAGAGLSHGVSSDVILNVNVMGPKRVCDAFVPLLDQKQGRIVNVSSGAASSYIKGSMSGAAMGKAKSEEKAPLISFDVTWEQILGVVEAERKAGNGTVAPFDAYGLSKAAVTAYTMTLAKEHPNITSSSCSPGFVATAMTKGEGPAGVSPEKGTVSIRHCLLGKLGGNGWYFGSDAKRSPLDRSRNPGEPEYDPEAKVEVLLHVYQMRGGAPPFRGNKHISTETFKVPKDMKALEFLKQAKASGRWNRIGRVCVVVGAPGPYIRDAMTKTIDEKLMVGDLKEGEAFGMCLAMRGMD